MVLWIATALTALALDWGCLALSRSVEQGPSVWPGAAVVLAMMLMRDGRGAWGRFVAGTLAAIMAGRLEGEPGIVSLALAAASSLGIAIVFLGQRRMGGIDLERLISVMKFLALAAAAAVISGMAGAFALQLLRGVDPLVVWPKWVLADWLGYAAIAPPILVLSRPWTGRLAGRVNLIQGALVLLAYTAILLAVFTQSKYPLLFVTTLALFAVAYLMELEGVMMALLITVVVGTAFSMIHRGPSFLVRASTSDRLLVLQAYLAALALAFLPISAVMTERRRLEQALRDAHAQSEAASALKSQFLADISHELRTPLASILGFAGILKNNPQLGRDEREHAESIAVAGAALLTTANDVLAFSELEAKRFDIHREPASAAAIASDALRLVQAAAAAKGLTATLTVADGTPAGLLIDAARVRQVLLNLLANAVKFTDQGGVAVTVSHDGRMLHVSVADTGPGIEADYLPLLFDRFSRPDPDQRRRHGGAGLGLAICKGLVEAMGGTITVAGAAGQGAILSFAIPAPAVQALERVPQDIAATLRPRMRRLLLAGRIADPGWARAILGPLRLEIAYVDDGPTACALVAARVFDLVLIDADAAALDGPGLVRAIRAADGLSAKALIMGVADHPGAVAPLREAGADGALTKPLAPGDLIGLVMSPHKHTSSDLHDLASQPVVGTNVH